MLYVLQNPGASSSLLTAPQSGHRLEIGAFEILNDVEDLSMENSLSANALLTWKFQVSSSCLLLDLKILARF